MKSLRTFSFATAALATVVLAGGAAQSRLNLVDKETSVDIVARVGILIQALDEQRTKVTAKGVQANWNRRNLELTTPEFVGVVRQASGQQLILETATMKGPLKVVIERQSSIQVSSQSQTAVLNASGGDYSAAKNQIDLDGPVTIDQSDPAAQQSMSIRGTSGSVGLYASPAPAGARTAVRTASMRGPVAMEMSRMRKTSAGSQKTNVDVRADRLDYDDLTGTFTLTGNVVAKGNEPALFGTLTGAKMFIRLDKAGNIREVETVGEPGTASIKQPPTGGSAR
jgi:hypothetical protein